MLRDGTLEIKGPNVPEFATENCSDILLDLEQNYKLPPFSKPDYFASSAFVDGLVSAQEFTKKRNASALFEFKDDLPQVRSLYANSLRVPQSVF
jgi:hypothetical protein